MRQLQSEAVYDERFVSFDESSIAPENIAADDPLLTLEVPLNCWRYRFVKRAIDVLCAFSMLIVFAIPGLVIAALIRLTTRGPVFYREVRIGRDGVPFRIWKFRSMRPHQPSRPASNQHSEGTVLQWRIRKHMCDPRITPIGRFLRRWSLDELPQLFNVLRGEMSLVGPRPVVKGETYLYKDLLPFYLAATPGLSGLWQVSGRSNLDYDERAQLDAKYVKGWSLGSDIKILFKTVPAVLGRVGAR